MSALLLFLLLLLLEQAQCKRHARQLRQTLSKMDCLGKFLLHFDLHVYSGPQGLSRRKLTFSRKDTYAPLRAPTWSNLWPRGTLPSQSGLHISLPQWPGVFHPLNRFVFPKGLVRASWWVAPANFALRLGRFFLCPSDLVLLSKRYVPEYRQRDTDQIPRDP